MTVPVRAQEPPTDAPPAAETPPAPAAEPAPAADVEAESEAAEDEGFPFGGTVIYENSLGRGTFLTDAANARPYWNMWLRLQPHYDVHGVDGLRVALRFDVSVNVVENADSGNNHPNQIHPGDLRIIGSWSDFLTWEPIGFGLSGSLGLSFPTSYLSQLVTKVMGVHLGLGAAVAPFDWLEVHYGFGFTKNFNLYTHAVLDEDDFVIAPLSRAGGAEGVAEGLTATGSAATSHAVSNELGVTFTFLQDFSVGISWEMAHAFSYTSYDIDKWSSPNAVGGPGQTDVMLGTLEIGWEVFEYLSLALGTVTEQAPKHADNDGFRFPFWDTSNGAANRQVFYLDAIGTF